MNYISPSFIEKYTPPDYAFDTSNNNMTTKNENYDNFIKNKNTAFSNFYANISNTVFNSGNSFNGFDNTTAADNIKATVDNYKNSTGYISNYDYNTGYTNLLNTNIDVNKKRMEMDIAISKLNSPTNLNNNNDNQILYNSHFFLNILWIILATTLIYYIFTQI